jgi:hypothetical protein
MYDEEKFAQLEQSAEKATIANVVDLGDVVGGVLEFVSDPGGSVFCAVVIFLVLGVWFLIKLILESFSGGPSQGLLG